MSYSDLKAILPINQWKLRKHRLNPINRKYTRWIEVETAQGDLKICFTQRTDPTVDHDFRILRAAPSMLRLLLEFAERPRDFFLEEDWQRIEEILDSLSKEG